MGHRHWSSFGLVHVEPFNEVHQLLCRTWDCCIWVTFSNSDNTTTPAVCVSEFLARTRACGRRRSIALPKNSSCGWVVFVAMNQSELVLHFRQPTGSIVTINLCIYSFFGWIYTLIVLSHWFQCCGNCVTCALRGVWQAVAPYLPRENPQLSPAIYELVLNEFLQVNQSVSMFCLLVSCLA